MVFVLPCLAWSANLTVTVTDANGAAVSGADVVAVSFSSMGPVGSSLAQTNASGSATLTLTDNLQYQVIAVKTGYLPSARDQMFDWHTCTSVGTADITKTIQLHSVTAADKVKDVKVTVTHDVASGDLIFLNLMNKGNYEQAGMGFAKSGWTSGTENLVCYIYSAPTSSQDYPYQLDVYNPTSHRGNRVAVNNKPDKTVAENASALNIASSNGGAMAPPTRQVETDEKLGDVVFEGRAIKAGSDTGIEDVNVNIHDNSNNINNPLNINTQTDSNGYYCFYESADAANKIFTGGHQYSVSFNKHGYMGDWQQVTYVGTKSTMTVTMTPVNGMIKGKVNIKVGTDLIPIPQAWVNAWGDGHNYGTGQDGQAGCDRKNTMGNASGPVTKGSFLLDGLTSGRYTINIWSEFNNQPIIYNNGPDEVGAADSNKWDTAGASWGDDLIVEIDTTTNGGYAKVYSATTPHTEVTLTDNNIVINITKNPDGTNSITGQVTFTGTTDAIDPSNVLIVAREDYKNDGTRPKSGFTVLKAADKVSAYVYNYSITGLADAVYRVEIKVPGFGMKVDNNGPRTNENVTLKAGGATTAVVNFKMAPSGIIEGVLRTPKGTIYTPKFDGPDNSNASVNANSDIGCWGWAQIEKDGKFRIEGLLSGKYQLNTQGWGNAYTYATAQLSNITVEAGKTTTVEIPLRRGVKVHPVLSQELPAAIKANLIPDPTIGERGHLSIVYTPASVSLSANNIDQVFQIGKGGNSGNTIYYWNNNFQDLSLEPGAYNFYMIYENSFPNNSNNYSKTVIGRAKNVVVDLSKQTDQYAQNGSTMNMVSVQNIPVTVSVGSNTLSGSYTGANTLRQADMDVIASNFNLFLTYLPRATLIDNDGNILATGMCTPTPKEIEDAGLDEGGNTVDPAAINKIKDCINSMSYGISFLAPKENVKLVVTTPNYPPLIKSVKVPGTVNVNMDTDVGAGAKITGTLRNAAGQAVTGASIRIKGRLLNRFVKSQADGSYLIPGLAPGVYRLAVSADGYALEAEKVVIYNTDTLVNFALTPCAGVITGTVYSQKFPYPLVAPGAQVVAYDDTANGLNPTKELAINEVVTDNDGVYKISPVIEGHTYKVALVVPGKAVQIFSPSPAVPTAAPYTASNIDFTYKSMAPKVKLIARPDPNSAAVTLQGESPRKLNSLTAKYNEGATYSDTTATALTVTTIGQKSYSITLSDKTKSYAVRFTADDGGSTQDLDFLYNPKNKAQCTESIDQQVVASGDVVLDSQGNDTSGLFISPGSITLGDNSVPEITINKENREGSASAAFMASDEVGGDVYNIDISMDGSQQNTDKTLTLTVGYDPSLVGGETDSISVCQYNETTHTWDPILGAPMVDPISDTVSIEVKSIANAAADSGSAAPRRTATAQFDGKEYRLSPRNAASSNQKGIFMVSKAPARLAYAGSALEVFNVPNPFNLKDKTVTLNRGGSIPQITTGGTIIRFAVPASFGTGVKTRFRIYNIAGELVRELNGNDLLAGGVDGGFYYYLDWDGKNASGEKCASGVYLCVSEVGSQKKVIKMALIK